MAGGGRARSGVDDGDGVAASVEARSISASKVSRSNGPLNRSDRREPTPDMTVHAAAAVVGIVVGGGVVAFALVVVVVVGKVGLGTGVARTS
jgi:hypothetical protein